MDIVERLRQKGERVQIPCPDGIDGCLVYHFQIKTDPDCAEAADEIERLREALKVIADSSEGWGAFAEAALQQKDSE